MTHLSCTIEDDLAILCLDNPPQNRLGPKMVEELRQALHTIETSEARAVLLRANGPDFSFGGDIEPWPDWTEREMRAEFEVFMQTFNQFERLPMPTVAAVQGLCLGGGFELALRSDVIFAGESACFGHPEQSIAIVTLLGGIYRVAERAGRSRAMEWALTSERVPAAEMERFGVINKVVPDADLDDAATAFARKLATGSDQGTRGAQGAAAHLGGRRRSRGRRSHVRHRTAALRDRGHADRDSRRDQGHAVRPAPARDAVPGPVDAAMAKLSYDVHVAPGIPTAIPDLPPDLDRRWWSPITSTLISGESDAVLVDPLMTVEQARQPGGLGGGQRQEPHDDLRHPRPW